MLRIRAHRTNILWQRSPAIVVTLSNVTSQLGSKLRGIFPINEIALSYWCDEKSSFLLPQSCGSYLSTMDVHPLMYALVALVGSVRL